MVVIRVYKWEESFMDHQVDCAFRETVPMQAGKAHIYIYFFMLLANWKTKWDYRIGQKEFELLNSFSFHSLP